MARSTWSRSKCATILGHVSPMQMTVFGRQGDARMHQFLAALHKDLFFMNSPAGICIATGKERSKFNISMCLMLFPQVETMRWANTLPWSEGHRFRLSSTRSKYRITNDRKHISSLFFRTRNCHCRSSIWNIQRKVATMTAQSSCGFPLAQDAQLLPETCARWIPFLSLENT